MSRREKRDSDPKSVRSRIDRESSPKRSRRDEADGFLSKKDLDERDGFETDKKPRQSLRDAVPLEPDEKKLSGHHETAKQAPHLSQGLRSRPYHQHDDRRTTGKDDRRATSGRELWRDSRDQSNRRAGDNDKSRYRKDDHKGTWRHDRFHESDDTQGALSKKRPAFREKKIPEESENTERTRSEAKDTNLNSRRHDERNWRSNMHSERHERPATGRDRVWNRDDERGAGSRQSYRTDRDRNGRSGFHGSWTRAEKKWDHDLFEEANKSPSKANEEEQVAKVEALLAT